MKTGFDYRYGEVNNIKLCQGFISNKVLKS